jgi:hypothetical protein
MKPPRLSTDLEDSASVPYFAWDDPLTVGEIRDRLRSGSELERNRWLGRILREARDTDVWRFTTPRDVASRWTAIEPYLGRRRAFWTYMLDAWRRQGLLDAG